jgi:hypothetical protein
MQIYLTIQSIPELSQLSPAQRDSVWRRVSLKTFRHWQTWVAFIACAVSPVLGDHLGENFVQSLLGSMAGGACGVLLFSQTVIYVARSYYSNLLRGDARS